MPSRNPRLERMVRDAGLVTVASATSSTSDEVACARGPRRTQRPAGRRAGGEPRHRRRAVRRGHRGRRRRRARARDRRRGAAGHAELRQRPHAPRQGLHAAAGRRRRAGVVHVGRDGRGDALDRPRRLGRQAALRPLVDRAERTARARRGGAATACSTCRRSSTSTPPPAWRGWRRCWRRGRSTATSSTCRWWPSRRTACCATPERPSCARRPCGSAPTSSAGSRGSSSPTATPPSTSPWACRLAAATGSRVAMLTDDAGDPALRTTAMLAEAMIEHGLQGRGVACHARALATYPTPSVVRLADLARAAGLGFVSDPHTGPLHLPVREFLDDDLPVALGQDDIEDAYYPFGRHNMLEVAFLAAHVLGFLSGPDQLRLLDLVTERAARVLGIRGPRDRRRQPGRPLRPPPRARGRRAARARAAALGAARRPRRRRVGGTVADLPLGLRLASRRTALVRRGSPGRVDDSAVGHRDRQRRHAAPDQGRGRRDARDRRAAPGALRPLQGQGRPRPTSRRWPTGRSAG